MSSRPACQTADFFVLRSPSLPMGAVFHREAAGVFPEAPRATGSHMDEAWQALRLTLQAWARRGPVREALALASPDLTARLDLWLEGALDAAAAANVERSLLKYLSRMSTRSTPFGLFAGLSMGAWGSSSHLVVAPWLDCRRAVRLDWGALEAVVDALERDAEVRAALTYRPNSSLYARGGWYRYLERRGQAGGQGRTYHLEAVEATAHLDFALQQACAGTRLEELVPDLAAQAGVAPEEARTFLHHVIDAQLLCGNLQPPLTSPDPLGHVASVLQAHPPTASKADPLATLSARLASLREAPPGSHPEGYSHLVEASAFGLPPDTRDLLQVDLFRPAPGLTLSSRVRRALEEGAETLRRLAPPPAEGPLDRFRAAFQARYDARWMPLLEVLDEESGIGFDGGAPLDLPLLEGVPFRGPESPQRMSDRDQYLMAQASRWQGTRVWALTEADLEALANPDPPPFPPSFAALACLAADGPEALDQGDFQFWMEQYSGPTAARWLGRFASGDGELREALHQHLRKEEASRPEAVFAEVVHVPEGRMGNVLARPALREYEIPFLAAAGVPDAKTILPSDLRVAVRGNRVCLASVRLGKEVVPRLSSAHNYALGAVVYRFLAHLQDQDGPPAGWSWGALARLPFLPRVVRGRHVFSKARWRIEARDLKTVLVEAGGKAWGAFQALQSRLGLPRLVMLADADNHMQVDLDRAPWVEMLHHLVSGRPHFTLVECFPDPSQAVVASTEGRFAHELVIPFEAPPPAAQAIRLPALSQDPGIRSHPPGSEWLYLKLYCGRATADRLLVEFDPFLRATDEKGLWEQWHFVRYADPDSHLRLRFRGRPERLLAELLPLVHGHLKGSQAQGLLWKWQVDTFEPELERYGGPLGLALAEAWFLEDSRWVLDALVAGLPPEDRWRAGLREVDAIWAALGLDLPARHALAQASRESFRREFRDPGDGAIQMGTKFRPLRKELEQAIYAGPGEPPAPGLAELGRIREAAAQGQILETLENLAGSLAHMHLNRLFRSHPREQEWVLMEFLSRLYESRLARKPKAP